MTLFALYVWPILAASIAAPALALLGCHLSARDKSMQTLCIGQGATLGVLVGIALLHSFDVAESVTRFGPLLTAALFSGATYFVSEKISAKHTSSKNTYYSSVFGVLMALGYLVCALAPSLEHHMSQVFFGDLATVTNLESITTLVLSVGLFGFLASQWRALSSLSFNLAIFGGQGIVRGRSWGPFAFSVVTLIALTYSVQFLGFLFTVTCLFLPTTLGTMDPRNGLKEHFRFVILISILSTVIGFLISLSYSRLPTAPTIVSTMVVFGMGYLSLRRVLSTPSSRRVGRS